MTSTTMHTTALRKQCQANISTNHTTLGQHSLCKFTNANKSKLSQLLVLLGQDRSDGYLSVAVTQVHAHQPIKRHGKRVSTITHTHANTNTNAHKYTYVHADTYTHTYVHRPFHHPVYITPTDIKHPINYCMSQNIRDQKCLRMKNS